MFGQLTSTERHIIVSLLIHISLKAVDTYTGREGENEELVSCSGLTMGSVCRYARVWLCHIDILGMYVPTRQEREIEEIVSCSSVTMGSVCQRPVMSQQCHREKHDHESKERGSDRILCAIVGA